jgi:hypothetical protein
MRANFQAFGHDEDLAAQAGHDEVIAAPAVGEKETCN